MATASLVVQLAVKPCAWLETSHSASTVPVKLLVNWRVLVALVRLLDTDVAAASWSPIHVPPSFPWSSHAPTLSFASSALDESTAVLATCPHETIRPPTPAKLGAVVFLLVTDVGFVSRPTFTFGPFSARKTQLAAPPLTVKFSVHPSASMLVSAASHRFAPALEGAYMVRPDRCATTFAIVVFSVVSIPPATWSSAVNIAHEKCAPLARVSVPTDCADSIRHTKSGVNPTPVVAFDPVPDVWDFIPHVALVMSDP